MSGWPKNKSDIGLTQWLTLQKESDNTVDSLIFPHDLQVGLLDKRHPGGEVTLLGKTSVGKDSDKVGLIVTGSSLFMGPIGGGSPLVLTAPVRVAGSDSDDLYFNFGVTDDSSGFGIRSNGGTMQFKNNGGNWAALGSGGSGAGSHASRIKKVKTPTSSQSANTAFAISGLNMGTVDYSPDAIDVFVNGVLMKSGTAANVSSAVADYTVSAKDTLKFSFGIQVGDNISVTVFSSSI